MTVVESRPQQQQRAYRVYWEQLERLRREAGPEAVRQFIDQHALDEGAVEATRRAREFAAGREWRDTPATMANYLTKGAYRRHPYIDYLAAKFADAAEGRSTRQIWNLPGRRGKSLLGSQWGPAWCLDLTDGLASIILVSYGKDLAIENAVGVRHILQEYASELSPGARLRPGRERMDRFETIAGGGLAAAGIDGRVTGFGAGDGGGLILDDPFRNWMQAHSETRRDHVYNQFRGTLRNRLDQESAFIIVIHHRYHEDDITARLVADAAADRGDHWELVALPALAGPNDPLGRPEGAPLEAEMFTLEEEQARQRGLGSYLAAALEQQNPTPEEGNELLRAWFVLAEDSELPSVPDHAITSWDLKLKDREAGDYVVGQVWWRVGNASWLMGQLRGHYDHATTANAIALLAVRHPEAKRHIIEAAGSSDEVIPQLKKAIPGYEVNDEMAARLGMNDQERRDVAMVRRSGMGHLQPEPATEGSKAVRARAYITGPAEAGNVRMPMEAPFVGALLDELAAFPNGAHDDQVDAMSQGLKFIRKRRRITGATAADL